MSVTSKQTHARVARWNPGGWLHGACCSARATARRHTERVPGGEAVTEDQSVLPRVAPFLHEAACQVKNQSQVL